MATAKISLKSEAGRTTELFSYRALGTLNDHMLTMVAAENRSLDFHSHPDSDEMFLVVEGSMDMEFADALVHLDEGDAIVVPCGTLHRPVCTTLVKCMLIEKAGTLTKDNTGGAYKE